MGIFEKIFGKTPQPKTQINNYFRTLNGYSPVFTTWRGGIYESELCRAAIEAAARHASKLNIDIRGSAQPALTTLLIRHPCGWMTWSQFMARVMTILEVDNTCFIVPVRSEKYGERVGIYPVKPAWWELVSSEDNTPYVRFHFEGGKAAAERLDSIGILTRQQYKSDYFGDRSDALRPTLDLISIQNQGIQEAIKSSASFRFMAKFSNFANDDDLKAEQQRFTEKSLQAGSGGVLLFPNTYNEIKQIDSKPYTVSANEINAIRTNVFDYFNTNEKIIQNSGSDEDFDSYFNGKIEPFSIQLSEVLTKLIFTPGEIAHGNEIVVAANRLQYMSVAHKVALFKELADRGAILIDEGRALFNYPPLPDGAGQKAPIRGEFYDAIKGKEGENDGNETSE